MRGSTLCEFSRPQEVISEVNDIKKIEKNTIDKKATLTQLNNLMTA